ncbi:MAG: cytochrome c biogenesis protein [Candidatus Sulfotelmatobacter sp.]|jgi:heme exporter protein C
MKKAFPFLAVITALLVGYGFYLGLFVAPTERTMGQVQRIFYFHAPSGWTAFWLFFANLAASIVYLVKRNLKADALAVASAEVGVVFCTVVLVTGPLWARPVWGIWWTWDMRLTSTLVLWLIYVSYLLLRRFSEGTQTPVLAAVLAIFGALDVPLVYFSIWFFRTQHPQPVIGGGGSLDPAMRPAFWMNVLAFSCFGALLCWARYRIELMQRQADELEANASLTEHRPQPVAKPVYREVAR